MLYVYIGCFTFGILYSLISAFLGGDGADGADGVGADSAGVDIDIDIGADIDVGADMDVDIDADGAGTPSPFSPLVIASAITAFGAAGLISKLSFNMGDLASAAVSLGFAGLVGALIFFGVVKLMYSSQSNSTFSQEELVGIEAEVITPLPRNGLGEIAYVMNGIRYNMSARSAYQEEIRRGETVIVKEIAGNVAVVTQKVTIDKLDEMTENFDYKKTTRQKAEDDN